MRLYLSFISMLVTFSLLLWSCKSEEAGRPDTDDKLAPLESVTLTFDHPDCEIDGEPCVHLYFHYPLFEGDEPLADSLRIWSERKLFWPEPGATPMDPEQLAAEWFEDYNRYAEEIEGYRLTWAMERSVEKVFESENLVTLHFNEYSFTGGAHPHQVDTFRSFIHPGGQQLHLSDLTYDFESYEQLVALAEEEFRFSFELLENESMQEAGFHFLDGQFHLTENFAFTDYGLLFYFNTYEVAPYVTGPIAIELVYEDLEHLIRSRWLPPRNELAL